MKRRALGIAAVALLLSLAGPGLLPAAVRVNPAPDLVNPSFEDAGASGDVAAGWGRWGQWFNREEGWTPVRTGHCILGYHHWQIPDSNNSGVFQDVQGAVKGTTYTFGIYVNADKATGNSQDAVSIELRLESTVDGQQQTVASKIYKVADLKPNAWETLTVSGAPTNDTFRVLVVVTPSPVDGTRGGALRFYDAFLELAH